MTAAPAVAQSGAFVDGAGGLRFRLVSKPAQAPARGTVILAHAFAEEMNKSRRMCARMARLLATDGWHVVQTDLAGCGDSAGEFGDASWTAWVEDLRSELAGADARQPLWLWCVRGGALLAPEALAGRDDVNLLLWQPVVSGTQHLQQFLRLHAGARIVGAAKGVAERPMRVLRAGGTVEIGGYELGPALARGLENASFDLPRGYRGKVVGMELCPEHTPHASPLVQRLVERLREHAVPVEFETLAGPPFWQTQEIEESEPLLLRSLMQLRATDRAASRA